MSKLMIIIGLVLTGLVTLPIVTVCILFMDPDRDKD